MMSPNEKHLVFTAGMLLVLAISAYPFWRDRKVDRKGKREHPLSVASLLLVLLTIFVAGIVQYSIHFLQSPQLLIPAVEAFLLALALCAVFPIIALNDLKTRRLQYGKARAVAALVLIGLCFASVGVIGYRIFSSRIVDTAPFVSAPFNFRIKTAPEWLVVDTAGVDRKAIVALTRTKPSMHFTVIAGKQSAKLPITEKDLVAAARERMQKSAAQVTWIGETPLKLHEIEGTLLESNATVDGKQAGYVQWIGLNKEGYSYQLSIWAPASVPRETLKSEALSEFRHFELLGKTAYGGALEPAGKGESDARDYQSFTSGFSVKLVGSPWKDPVHDLFTTYPGADFGVACENSLFVVLALPMGTCDPSTDALGHVFLWRLGIESMEESVTNYKEITHGPLNGSAFDFQRASYPNILYRAEVLKGNGFAYLLLGKTSKIAPDAEAKLVDVLARVEFDAAPAQPKPSTFTTREREIRGRFLRELGQQYLKMNQFAAANDYFNAARELLPQKPLYLKDSVETMIAGGDYPGALSYLKANLKDVAGSDGLLVRMAWLQEYTGDYPAALENYAKAFASDFRDDTAFAAYLRLLGTQHQTDLAMSAAAKYLDGRDSREVRLAQAAIYREQKQFEPAVAILKDQLEKHPAESDVSLELAQTYLDAARYSEASQICDTLLKNGRPSATVHYLKGQSLYGLKAFEEAKASLEAALRQEPTAIPQLQSLLEKVSAEAPHTATP